MLREGSSLLKQPDIIIPDLDGPRSFTLIDVKIVDPAAPSYADSSAKSAQHRHRALEAAGPREYFGASRRPPPGSRMRICAFVVSSFPFGSLGTQALGLIKDIGRRTNLFVPPAFHHAKAQDSQRAAASRLRPQRPEEEQSAISTAWLRPSFQIQDGRSPQRRQAHPSGSDTSM